MEQTLVKIDPKQFGLEESKAADIAAQFQPMLDKMVELEKEYNEVIQLPIEEAAKPAKELRLKYVKIRTGTAAIHKAQKEFYLAGGRFVDGWKNAQLFASQGIEDKLQSIEDYAANKERERIAALQEERQSALIEFEMLDVPNLGSMADDVWKSFYIGAKTQYIARIEAERIAEEQRLAEIEAKRIEDERIRKENELLKAQAEQATRELEAERKRIQAEQAAERAEANRILEQQRKEQEKALEEQRRIARELQAEQEAKLKAEQDERNRIAKELQDKKDAELAQQLAAQQAAELELAKGDKEKFLDLINSLDSIKTKYQFKSKKYKDMHIAVGELINKTIVFAQSKTS